MWLSVWWRCHHRWYLGLSKWQPVVSPMAAKLSDQQSLFGFFVCFQYWTRSINSSPLNKMAAISQMIFSDAFLWMNFFCILIKISLKFVLRSLIDNNPTLVNIVAWRRIGNKPLCEPMVTLFNNAFMHHQGRWAKMQLLLLLSSYITDETIKSPFTMCVHSGVWACTHTRTFICWSKAIRSVILYFPRHVVN